MGHGRRFASGRTIIRSGGWALRSNSCGAGSRGRGCSTICVVQSARLEIDEMQLHGSSMRLSSLLRVIGRRMVISEDCDAAGRPRSSAGGARWIWWQRPSCRSCLPWQILSPTRTLKKGRGRFMPSCPTRESLRLPAARGISLRGVQAGRQRTCPLAVTRDF